MLLTLKIYDREKLKLMFKDRYNNYVRTDGSPKTRLVRLLCNSDDILRNKLRTTVEIIAAANHTT